MMNMSGGYVGLCNNDPQQNTVNTVVSTDLIHLGEHFNNVPANILPSQHCQNVGMELPWIHLFEMMWMSIGSN